jgi:hypothetical protein
MAEGEGGLAGLSSRVEGRAEERSEERGEYGFSSLLKQNIKGKNLLRHLHRRIFFLNFFML